MWLKLGGVYTHAEVCEMGEKEKFYTKLESTLDQCPSCDVLVALGYFKAVTGSEKAGYEICIGPMVLGPGTKTALSFWI